MKVINLQQSAMVSGGTLGYELATITGGVLGAAAFAFGVLSVGASQRTSPSLLSCAIATPLFGCVGAIGGYLGGAMAYAAGSKIKPGIVSLLAGIDDIFAPEASSSVKKVV